MKERTLVLGVGNILLSDDGFGVHTVEYLKQNNPIMEQVEILDGGTLGLDLLPTLRGVKHLILIDAISGGSLPGTVHVIEKKDLSLYFRDKVSVHQLGIQEVLSLLEVLEDPVEDILVLGVEPESLEVGLRMSTVVAEQVPHVAKRVMDQLVKWQKIDKAF